MVDALSVYRRCCAIGRPILVIFRQNRSGALYPSDATFLSTALVSFDCGLHGPYDPPTRSVIAIFFSLKTVDGIALA